VLLAGKGTLYFGACYLSICCYNNYYSNYFNLSSSVTSAYFTY